MPALFQTGLCQAQQNYQERYKAVHTDIYFAEGPKSLKFKLNLNIMVLFILLYCAILNVVLEGKVKNSNTVKYNTN